MDPIVAGALIGLAGKALGLGVDLIKTWSDRGSGGIALGVDGTRLDLGLDSRRGHPSLSEPARFGVGAPVPFEGVFVPADAWASEYLHVDQPVLVVIEDQDAESRLDVEVAVMPLGESFGGELFPSTYSLGAFVFLDHDFTAVDDIDGAGLVEFSVDRGEPPFRLTIPIEATSDVLLATPVMHVSAHLGPRSPQRYTALLAAGITYQVHVRPVGSDSEFDLYLYDENGNLVGVDDDAGGEALCIVTPRWTGKFTIVIWCRGERSAYELNVYESHA